MLDMKIDLSGLYAAVEDARPDMTMLQQGLKDAAVFVRDVWRSAVTGNVLPGMTRAVHDDKYASALATGDSLQFTSPLQVVVVPNGYADGVARIEEGYGPFDMKPGLLNGPKSQETKDGKGRFNTVPFRHFAPSGAGGGQSAMAIRMQMPQSIYNRAKKLRPSLPVTNPSPGGPVTQWGESLQTPSNFSGSNLGNYDGMYRVGSARQTQYLTFRRVATWREVVDKKGRSHMAGSPPESWWHPGMAPNPVVQAVYDYCMPIIAKNLYEIAEMAIR